MYYEDSSWECNSQTIIFNLVKEINGMKSRGGMVKKKIKSNGDER